MTSRQHANTVHLISLGCAKNTVDSASMGELLARAGFQLSEQAGQAGVIIVNTCGFIGPARDESYQVLSELAARKRKGQLLIAAGCLTQRYGAEVARRVPGIDGILGTRRWMDVVEVVQKLHRQAGLRPLYHLPEASTIGVPPAEDGLSLTDSGHVPRLAVQGGSAYLKIADGCRRPCAFCAIPLIKGTAISRPLQAILKDARFLAAQGVNEINLIAQDTTDYGSDLGLKDGLADLLEKLTDPALYGSMDRGRTPSAPADPALDGRTQGAPTDPALDGRTPSAPTDPARYGRPHGVVPTETPWIRVLYAYPGYVTDRLIEIMATRPQIVPYLDMPLQHAHPDTLRRMRRPANIEWVYRTLEKMRRQIPELALRTTFIVGYPGETEAEFQALLDFVAAMRFDRVGTFQFSFEAGTPSEPLGDPIPPEVKEDRYNRLMELQHGISLAINQTFIGQTLQVLIEGQEQPAPGRQAAGILVGRSYRDAPEIDGVVVVEDTQPAGSHIKDRLSAQQALIGKIVPVRITGALAYDLNGVLDLPEA